MGKGDLTVFSNISGRDELALIAKVFDEIKEKVEGIQRSTRETVGDIDQILKVITEVYHSANEINQSSSQVDLSAGKLSELSGELKRLVNSFKV
ncbi:MAG: hypothetical protein JEZ12_24510 [Desulfobacterium sp.]|nr:hypothetical protein [Desulfobacterium sp.]